MPLPAWGRNTLAMAMMVLCSGAAATAEPLILTDGKLLAGETVHETIDTLPAGRETADVRFADREDGQSPNTVKSVARRVNPASVDTSPYANVLPRPKPPRPSAEPAVEEATAPPEKEAPAPEPEPESVLPKLTVSNAEADESASEIVFNLVLSEPLDSPILILYATYDRTAIAGEDYRREQGTLKLAPGTSSATVRVPLINDDVSESNETLELFVATDGKLATVDVERTVGTILNDDD